MLKKLFPLFLVVVGLFIFSGVAKAERVDVELSFSGETRCFVYEGGTISPHLTKLVVDGFGVAPANFAAFLVSEGSVSYVACPYGGDPNGGRKAVVSVNSPRKYLVTFDSSLLRTTPHNISGTITFGTSGFVIIPSGTQNYNLPYSRENVGYMNCEDSNNDGFCDCGEPLSYWCIPGGACALGPGGSCSEPATSATLSSTFSFGNWLNITSRTVSLGPVEADFNLNNQSQMFRHFSATSFATLFSLPAGFYNIPNTVNDHPVAGDYALDSVRSILQTNVPVSGGASLEMIWSIGSPSNSTLNVRSKLVTNGNCAAATDISGINVTVSKSGGSLPGFGQPVPQFPNATNTPAVYSGVSAGTYSVALRDESAYQYEPISCPSVCVPSVTLDGSNSATATICVGAYDRSDELNLDFAVKNSCSDPNSSATPVGANLPHLRMALDDPSYVIHPNRDTTIANRSAGSYEIGTSTNPVSFVPLYLWWDGQRTSQEMEYEICSTQQSQFTTDPPSNPVVASFSDQLLPETVTVTGYLRRVTPASPDGLNLNVYLKNSCSDSNHTGQGIDASDTAYLRMAIRDSLRFLHSDPQTDIANLAINEYVVASGTRPLSFEPQYLWWQAGGSALTYLNNKYEICSTQNNGFNSTPATSNPVEAEYADNTASETKTLTGYLRLKQAQQATLNVDANIVNSACAPIGDGTLAGNGISNTSVSFTLNGVNGRHPGVFSVNPGISTISNATISRAGYVKANECGGGGDNINPNSIDLEAGETGNVELYFKPGDVQADYNISVIPETVTYAHDPSRIYHPNYTIEVVRQSGFAEDIEFTIEGLPQGVTIRTAPADSRISDLGDGSKPFSLNVSGSLAVGSYTFTVRGRGANSGTERTDTSTIIINNGLSCILTADTYNPALGQAVELTNIPDPSAGQFRFSCDGSGNYSAWQFSNNYDCSYNQQGSFIPRSQAQRGTQTATCLLGNPLVTQERSCEIDVSPRFTVLGATSNLNWRIFPLEQNPTNLSNCVVNAVGSNGLTDRYPLGNNIQSIGSVAVKAIATSTDFSLSCAGSSLSPCSTTSSLSTSFFNILKEILPRF